MARVEKIEDTEVYDEAIESNDYDGSDTVGRDPGDRDADGSTVNDDAADGSPGVYEIEFTSGAMKDLGLGTYKVKKNIGATIHEAIELFGEEPVYSLYRQKAVVILQGRARDAAVKPVRDESGQIVKTDDGKTIYEPDKTQAEIQDLVTDYKFGVLPTRGKSKGEKLVKSVSEMDNLEEIQKLQAALDARKASLGIS